MLDILSNLTGIAQAVPAIMTGLKGKSTKNQKAAASNIYGMAQSQVDMDTPAFQKLYTQERAAGQQDLASTIAEISRQNRKLGMMGRRPLLDQERGGENVFRNLMLSQQGVGDRARRAAFDQLSRGLSGYQSAYNTYGDVAAQDYENDLRRANAMYSIGDALKYLFSLYGNRSSGAQTPIRDQRDRTQFGDYIAWNGGYR